MFIVISYDIVDDTIRKNLSDLLLDYGTRVQKSVFECILDEDKYIKIKQQIESMIDLEKDSVRYYFLCEGCKGRIEISGRGIFVSEEDIIVY